ncbi:MAG: L,D-transpeptidase [Verrucomicrobiales bacterium]
MEPPPPPAPPPAPDKKPVILYEWNGDGVSGPLAVRINTNHQKAYLTKGGKDVGWTYVATGLHSHPTPVGSFRIQEKTADKHSNLWGKIYNSKGRVVVRDARNGRDGVPSGGRFEGASMRYWMRLTGDGIGMHSGPIPRPGNRASHGCIRLPSGFAPILFRHAVIGTPVKIEGSGPKWKPAPPPPPKPAPTEGTGPGETPPDSTNPSPAPNPEPAPAPVAPPAVEPPAPAAPEAPPAPPAGGES